MDLEKLHSLDNLEGTREKLFDFIDSHEGFWDF